MSKRILVADDEPDLLSIVQSILETKGYEIETVNDGREALQALQGDLPDLLIIDLMMPVLSGLEVVRRLKKDERTRDLPIIVMSAAGKESGKDENFFRQGLNCDDFIAKPFDPLNLLGRVEAVLRMNQYGGEKSAQPQASAPASAPPVSSATVGGVKLDALPSMGPGEIVKAFIESWNNQDFAVEYHCLAEPMTGSLPQKSYVLRRQQAFADDGGAREQRVKRVVDMKADDKTARVVVEREDTVRGHGRTRLEDYELVRGPNNWQIKMVRPHSG